MNKCLHHLKWLSGLMALGLLACTEQEPVTYHEPHLYKGKKDPHTPSTSTLENRFKQTQTDR